MYQGRTAVITSPTALLRAALVALAGISLPSPAALALADQSSPTAFIVSEDFAPLQQQWQPAAGTWSVSKGTYNSTAAGSADITTIVAYRAIDPSTQPSPVLSFGQYSLSARVQIKGNGLAGVVYQYRDPANYFEAVLSTDGTVSLRRTFLGSTDRLRSINLGIQANTWYVVEVLWNNGRTTLSVDGQPVFVEFAQPGSQAGQVGLATHDTAANFDKLQVTTPFGNQPFKHDFSTDAPGWTAQSGQWSVLNGTYRNAAVQQTNVTLAPIDIGIHAPETGAYTLHVRMLNPYGGPGNLVGIVFNYGGSQYAEVVFSPTGVAKMNLVANGRVQTLATAAYGGRPNAWFDVTFNSSTRSVWVDGERIFDDVPDPDPGQPVQGGVGLITHWAPGRFDDVWFDHGSFRPCSETFSGGPVPEIASGTWTVSAGALNATSVNVSSIALPCRGSGDPFGNDAGTDFVYSGRLFNPYGGSGNLVGLIFNYHDRSSLYAGDYYELVFSPTGSAVLNKFIQGVSYRVGTFPHNVPRNTWFDVQLFRSGIYTTFKVNGATIARDVPQGELRGGRVGVVTHWAPGRFDNLSLQPNVVRSGPVTYTLTHIATPPPDSQDTGIFWTYDLNDEGAVAGTRVGADGTQQAFVWRAGTFQNLNPLLPSQHGAGAQAINNQFDVAGAYQDQQFQGRPFLLSRTGQLIPLNGMPSGSITTIDANDRREILLSAPGPNGLQSFIWRNGQVTPLPLLPGNTNSFALAINNNGVALGYATVSLPFQPTPVLWQGGTVMPIGRPEGSAAALPAALNDHNVVVGTAAFDDTFPRRTATYIWDEGETTILMSSDPALTHTAPRDINNRGVVVGESYNTTGGHAPTIWDGTRGQDANTLISRQDPLQPFVRLDLPVLINNRGQIVAHGVDSRQPNGWRSFYLLTPVAAQ
jgi:uncharacterized membrane protein